MKIKKEEISQLNFVIADLIDALKSLDKCAAKLSNREIDELKFAIIDLINQMATLNVRLKVTEE